MKRTKNSNLGATAPEYIILISLISLTVISSLTNYSLTTQNLLNTVGNSFSATSSGAGGTGAPPPNIWTCNTPECRTFINNGGGLPGKGGNSGAGGYNNGGYNNGGYINGGYNNGSGGNGAGYTSPPPAAPPMGGGITAPAPEGGVIYF